MIIVYIYSESTSVGKVLLSYGLKKEAQERREALDVRKKLFLLPKNDHELTSFS